MVSKYRNKKTFVDGVEFDSKREALRYSELKLLEKGKKISGLILQPSFLLMEGFTDCQGVRHRPVRYIADFMYQDCEDFGLWTVEDVKGVRTPVYKLKLKMFRHKYPKYKFFEV